MMEVVRQIVDGSELANVIPLPVSFRDRRVEITVRPLAERSSPSISAKNLDEMLKGSITQSLIGAVPISEISLEETRRERLKKYESLD